MTNMSPDAQQRRVKSVTGGPRRWPLITHAQFGTGRYWVPIGVFAIVAGAAVTVKYSFEFASSWIVAGILLLLAGAHGMVGAVLGFIFGVPRTSGSVADLSDGAGFSQGSPVSSASTRESRPGFPRAADAEHVQRPVTLHRPNTSLEQISEWLTKVLVGAGLTQLSDAPQNLWNFATNLGDAITVATGDVGGGPHAAFILGLIVYYAAVGFVLAYIATRTDIAVLFRRADLKLSEVEDDITAILARREDLALGLRRMSKIEEEMGKKLYEKGGYLDVIALGREYLASVGDEGANFYFWLRLACAWGQKHAALTASKHAGVDDELAEAVESAVAAAKKMFQLDAALAKYYITLYGDPAAAPSRTDPRDNDLESLFGHPDFAALMTP